MATRSATRQMRLPTHGLTILELGSTKRRALPGPWLSGQARRRRRTWLRQSAPNVLAALLPAQARRTNLRRSGYRADVDGNGGATVASAQQVAVPPRPVPLERDALERAHRCDS